MDEYRKMELLSQARRDELVREASQARLLSRPGRLRMLFTLTALVFGMVALWLR
ncbi:MAG: hypothetical protein HYY33_04585 [Chloroflexi bacterium]|nr:hypothetical protein [Chloroflexota bacterium]